MDEERIDIVKRKSRWTIIGMILYGAYIPYTIIVIRNIHYISFSVIMMIMYINVVSISKAIYSNSLTDRQRMWREAVKSFMECFLNQ